MSQLRFQLLFMNKRLLVLLVLATLLLAGCAESGQMAEQPRYDPLEPSQFFDGGTSALQLPEGVVPFAMHEGTSPFFEGDGEPMSPNSPVLTGLDEGGAPVQGSPLPVDGDFVTLGQERYNIYCVPCHGPAGEGNGVTVQFGMPKPPSLLEANAQGLTSGEIFDIITHGRGVMYPYGYRVQPNERWAIIAYVRALQLKGGPADPAALTPDELQSIEGQP